MLEIIRVIAVCSLFSVTLMQPVWAFALTRTDSICDHVALSASQKTDVPFDILKAIARTETGRQQNGELIPWPWTLNVNGRGYWFDTQLDALDYATRVIHQGLRSIDLGCFQINLRWHGTNFLSVSAMLDPKTNADYAARFLRDLYETHGTWRAAVAAYHSNTPRFARAYLQRFEPIFDNLTEGGARSFLGQSHSDAIWPFQASSRLPEIQNTGSLFPRSRSRKKPFIGQ